jgi:hypothetical protein
LVAIFKLVSCRPNADAAIILIFKTEGAMFGGAAFPLLPFLLVVTFPLADRSGAMTPAELSASALRDVLFYGDFPPAAQLSLPSLFTLKPGALKAQGLAALRPRCNASLHVIQALDADALAGALVCGTVLQRGGLVSDGKLPALTLDSQRNTLIAATAARAAGKWSVKALQALPTLSVAGAAYETWFIRAADGGRGGALLSALGNLSAVSAIHFQVRTVVNETSKPVTVGLDCPSIVPFHSDDRGLAESSLPSSDYLALFHTLSPTTKGTFDLYTARSSGSSLGKWVAGSRIATRASMGKVYLSPGGMGGVLILFEANTAGVGPSVAASWWPEVSAMIAGSKASQHFLSTRSLSKCAEGTPSLLAVERLPALSAAQASGAGPRAFSLTIGMHFYQDCRRDQQAYAVLHGMQDWQAAPCAVSNAWLQLNGWSGKAGDRSRFSSPGAARFWELLEVQRTLDDWASWRILLGDGLGFTEVLMTGAHGATSFANPYIFVPKSEIDDDEKEAVVTMFLPSQGNTGQTAGDLIYSLAL